jgi:septal ring factor EnvC (AmiA/AmiB activator)
MSASEISCLLAALVAIMSSLAVVWRMTWSAAVKFTETDMRLSAQERFRQETEQRHSKLAEALDRLSGSLQDLRADIRVQRERQRASQHDIQDTDPPPRDRR